MADGKVAYRGDSYRDGMEIYESVDGKDVTYHEDVEGCNGINYKRDYTIIRSGNDEKVFSKNYVAYDWFDTLTKYMGRKDVQIEKHRFSLDDDGNWKDYTSKHKRIVRRTLKSGEMRYYYK